MDNKINHTAKQIAVKNEKIIKKINDELGAFSKHRYCEQKKIAYFEKVQKICENLNGDFLHILKILNIKNSQKTPKIIIVKEVLTSFMHPNNRNKKIFHLTVITSDGRSISETADNAELARIKINEKIK